MTSLQLNLFGEQTEQSATQPFQKACGHVNCFQPEGQKLGIMLNVQVIMSAGFLI